MKVGSIITLPEVANESFIISRISTGGMGVVYFLRPLNPLNREYALKMYKQVDDRALFEREAELWSQLSWSPYIAEFICYGYLKDRPYILSAKYESDLSGYRFEHLSASEALRMVAGIILGLKLANERLGLIHKDLKPQNIFVQHGLPRVGDFGLAGFHRLVVADKLRGSGIAEQATMGPISGTLPYMAPEIIHERAVPSILTDIYGLGVTLFAWITNQLPLDPLSCTPNVGGLRLLQQYLRDLQELRLLVLRCIHPDPSQRLRSYSEALSLLPISVQSIPPEQSDREVARIVTYAQTRRKMNQHPFVLEFLKQSLRVHHDHPLLINQVAIALKEIGKEAEAERTLRELFVVPLNYDKKEYLDPLCNLAQCYLSRGDIDGLVAAFDKAAPSLDMPVALGQFFELGIYAYFTSRFGDAFRALAVFFQAGHDDLRAALCLFAAAIREGRTGEALGLLQERSKSIAALLPLFEEATRNPAAEETVLQQIEERFRSGFRNKQ
jgi:serine/threonine protein kinase